MSNANRPLRLSYLTSALLCITLAACGGGGDDNPTSATNTSAAQTNTNPNGTQTTPTNTTPQAQFASRFNTPNGIASDAAGNLYVVDQLNYTVRKITPTGVVSTIAGIAGSKGTTDGALGVAKLNDPRGIAVHPTEGTIYVADGQTVRKISATGNVITILGGLTSAAGIALDAANNIYVADAGGHEIVKGSPDGTITHLANNLNGPQGIAVDATGNIVVTDVVPVIGTTTVKRVSSTGVITTAASTDATGGTLNNGAGVAIDATGNIVFLEKTHILKVSPANVVTELTLTGATPSSFAGITVAPSGDYYVTDSGNHTVSKVTTAGAVTLVAGKAGETGTADVAQP